MMFIEHVAFVIEKNCIFYLKIAFVIEKCVSY